MANKPKRVIIGTNLWISFLITKNYTQLDQLIFENKVQLIFSQELLDEFLEVTQRPMLKNYFKQKDVTALVEVLEKHAELVTVTSNIEACRDSKDNFLLSLAVDGKADYLITGDKDLLTLQKFKKTKIVALTGFLSVK